MPPVLTAYRGEDCIPTLDSPILTVNLASEGKKMKKIVASASMVLTGLALTAAVAFAADSSLGTWKLNAAKSKYSGSYVVKSQTDVREATPDGGVKVTREAELGNGTAIKGSFTYKYDGKEYPATGLAFDVISVKRIDANTVAFDVKKTGGKYHVTGQSVISADGKTMTQTAKGTDAEGKPISSTAVFDKQ
jgi:hypothetical protein